MNFIKKHYEKLILGLVLFGLAGAVVYMLIEIPQEKSALNEMTAQRTALNNAPLQAPDTARLEADFSRLEKPTPVIFSGSHNLFNPVAWQKKPDGQLAKKGATSEGPSAVVVVKVNPLYTIVSFESAGASEDQFLISIEREAALRLSDRRKQSKYISIKSKADFATLREVKGTPEMRELTLELADTGELVKIAPGQPYKRIDGYSADLRYDPEKRNWPERRVGDRIALAGDEFTVAAINSVGANDYEVVLSARSTGKKTTIRFNDKM